MPTGVVMILGRSVHTARPPQSNLSCRSRERTAGLVEAGWGLAGNDQGLVGDATGASDERHIRPHVEGCLAGSDAGSTARADHTLRLPIPSDPCSPLAACYPSLALVCTMIGWLLLPGHSMTCWLTLLQASQPLRLFTQPSMKSSVSP